MCWWVWQHEHKQLRGFSARHQVDRLVYYEHTEDIASALEREKQLKRWTRAKKVALIEAANPSWRDPSEGWWEES